jgi:PAS domain S-box-containing protein
MFEEVPLGIAVENLDGHLLLVNPALCAMLGYNRDELERMTCSEFAHPADSSDDWALFKKLRSGEINRYSVEKRYIRKDGTPLWGRLNVSLVSSGNGGSVRVLALVEDITAHKEAEQVRSKHVAVVDSSADAIVSTTLDGVITDWNATAVRLLGYSQVEALGKHIRMIVPSELQGEDAAILHRLELGDRVEHHETVRMGKDGRRLTVSLSASSVQDSAGAIVGLSQVMRDVSESKNLSKALRESEERFRKVFREAGVGMAICSLEGRFFSANNALCMLLGYSENELIGKTLQSVVQAADWRSWLRWLEEGTGFHGVERRLLCKNGRTLTAETSAALIRDSDGKPLYFICEAVDVTERKNAEDAARQRERDLVEAQRLAGVGSWQWDSHTDRLSCSRELRRIAGLDPSNPMQRYQDLSRIFNAHTWEEVQRATDEALRSGTPYELEGEIVRPDGTTRWVVMRSELQRSSSGKTVLVRGTVQDITERKRAECELADLSARFVAAQEEERSHFARELHDDVSQRLALIVVTLDKFRGAPPASGEEIRGVFDDLFERMADVSSEIHRLSHRLHPSTLRLGLVPALRGLCMSIERQDKLSIATAWLDVPDSLPKDVSLCLYRVAQEALNNVIKHSGVKQARLELVGLPGRLTLRVVDLGKGFGAGAEVQTGLGLLSMRERLRLVGGTLTVHSQASHGTEVLAEVPIAENTVQFTDSPGT